MSLETLKPDPAWNEEAHASTVQTLRELGDEYRFRVWGDDGCKDCRAQLPAFAAALDAAGIPDERIIEYAVERLPEGKKRGPQVEAYDISRIPTVVVERNGTEVARFVESASQPLADFLASKLEEADARA